jgi:HD-GYP domain-containing protein (c-di-GMP phosphodiesterase class II)
MEEHDVVGVRLAASIHDLGKLAVPVEILTRPGRLTELERAMVQGHCRDGYDIVAPIEFPWPIAEMILQHHERLDGTGYPDQLRGDEILPGARVIAVADVVDAMTAHRPYRPALGVDAAVQELTANRATLYDPRMVDACVHVLHAGFPLTDETPMWAVAGARSGPAA